MKPNFRFIFIIILLTIAATISWKSFFGEYAQQDSVSIHTFPMTIGEWAGEEIPISERDLSILETKNAFTRRFTSPSGQEIVLFIVYSQHNRKAAHPPEICYSGGGMSILSSNTRMIEDAGANVSLSTQRMFVEAGKYQQVVNYWFKVGETFTSNYYRQQVLIAIKTLLGQSSSSAMIRVASDVQGGDITASDAAIREFSLEILPILPKYLP